LQYRYQGKSLAAIGVYDAMIPLVAEQKPVLAQALVGKAVAMKDLLRFDEALALIDHRP
jgi:hypothetical protein